MTKLVAPSSKPKEFTGKHMILVVGLFFGTIITVNLIMAYFAASSWTGLVVKNSYVASQHYNEKLDSNRAQNALGWTPSLTVNAGQLTYQLFDAKGAPVKADFVEAKLMRPSHERDDHVITMLPNAAGDFVADQNVGKGAWDIEAQLVSDNGTPFVYRERFIVE